MNGQRLIIPIDDIFCFLRYIEKQIKEPMKKTVFKFLMMALVVVTITSCSNDSDSETQEVPFAGEWSGTFSGDDSGPWNITVSSTGEVDGQVFSNNAQVSLEVTGNVDTSGEFRATAGSAENGATFTGTFTENSNSGAWENAVINISGTWQGLRD